MRSQQRRHLPVSVYIKSACGHFFEVTADTRWAERLDVRNLCKTCRSTANKLLNMDLASRARPERLADGWPEDSYQELAASLGRRNGESGAVIE